MLDKPSNACARQANQVTQNYWDVPVGGANFAYEIRRLDKALGNVNIYIAEFPCKAVRSM